MKIKLRDQVRDQITGYSGLVVARTEWLNGCVRLTVQSPILKDGLPMDPQTFDEQQLDLVTAAPVAAPAPASAPKPGGPRPEPRRAADPR